MSITKELLEKKLIYFIDLTVSIKGFSYAFFYDGVGGFKHGTYALAIRWQNKNPLQWKHWFITDFSQVPPTIILINNQRTNLFVTLYVGVGVKIVIHTNS